MAELPEDRITVCDHKDTWFAITMIRDPRLDPEPMIYSDFSFLTGGREFTYKGGLSKYSNDHDKVTRITVAPTSILIEIDPAVSTSSPYVFDRLAPGCREAVIAYVSESPWLRDKLQVLVD